MLFCGLSHEHSLSNKKAWPILFPGKLEIPEPQAGYGVMCWDIVDDGRP